MLVVWYKELILTKLLKIAIWKQFSFYHNLNISTIFCHISFMNCSCWIMTHGPKSWNNDKYWWCTAAMWNIESLIKHTGELNLINREEREWWTGMIRIVSTGYISYLLHEITLNKGGLKVLQITTKLFNQIIEFKRWMHYTRYNRIWIISIYPLAHLPTCQS